jgi:SAM-dependent methyltransferase
MGARPPLSAAYFDAWYAQMARFPAKDEIQRRHLGLPAHVPSTSSLTGAGIGEVCAALRLVPGGALLDLACGRGGCGLEVAARTGARLIGVDFSAEALRQAARLAQQLGRRAGFVVGELTATGLSAGSVHAVLCVDSIQFAEPQAAAYAEIRRVLAPGGRVVLTGWEPVQPGDPRLVSRLRDVDLHTGLRSAGFDEVTVHERPDWRQTERNMWEEAAALDPAGDPALESLHNEAQRVLDTFPLVRRVMATATAP